ncbi:hypothetical protein ACFTAO_47175 [Paenibacillus rhizoplanae]
MKAPTYVANVVSKYRMALDHKNNRRRQRKI